MTTDIEQKLADLVDDVDFQAIDRRMGRFNLFEAMGAVRGELRHSNFLAFMLSPSRNHGLGSEPLLRFLRLALAGMPQASRPIRALELLVGDLDGAVIHREWNNIDLLIEIKQLRLIVLIENKVGAKAGDGQLARYRKIVESRFPSERHLFVFLTPDGHAPDEDVYVATNYADLAKMIEGLAHEQVAGVETGTILRHYVVMLRRHIVPDQELQDLARLLYERHKEAFDYILKCRPDGANFFQAAKTLVEQTPEMTLDRVSSTSVGFVPKAWTSVADLNACDQTLWTRTGRSAVFLVQTYNNENYSYRLSLALVIGPAPNEIRERLYLGAKNRPHLFKGLVKPMGGKFATIYGKDLLSQAAGKLMDDEQRALVVQEAWKVFQEEDLPALTKAVLEIVAASEAEDA
ncbi:PD-(D/E)XK nuclease superfamily protein [Methylorubrum salsuginis]|uniref:PD-(D/E)XK nuclease superfamily protein n=2 Tax=Methylorubrum salsuginis TaxID=414703 RepID=A0A1I4N0V7_9HYPH|nr:PD-(D/E)XK nuclease superfamily protein [Methylorubrum salsuginis]